MNQFCSVLLLFLTTTAFAQEARLTVATYPDSQRSIQWVETPGFGHFESCSPKVCRTLTHDMTRDELTAFLTDLESKLTQHANWNYLSSRKEMLGRAAAVGGAFLAGTTGLVALKKTQALPLMLFTLTASFGSIAGSDYMGFRKDKAASQNLLKYTQHGLAQTLSPHEMLEPLTLDRSTYIFLAQTLLFEGGLDASIFDVVPLVFEP